jgi:exonuclease SbcC
MILDRLELSNFKRFRHEEIKFQDGITGILGNNGTGKSSLVQAIFFALYGVQATGIAADYIVSSFASPREKCEVRLDFRIGGDTCTVVRTFKKGKTVTHDASFHKNGKLMATGVSQVESEVKRTLGMGPVDFKNTIYAGQKDLLTLLENTPGKRKEWFQKALGIDYLKTESDAVFKKQAEEKTGELQKMTGTLEALTGRQSEEELKNLQASVREYQAAIAEHGKVRDMKRKEREALGAEQRALAEKKLHRTRLLQQQEALTKERDADELQKKGYEARIARLADEEAEYGRLKTELDSLDEVRQHLEDMREKKEEFLRLNGELRSADREIAAMNTQAERVAHTLDMLAADLQKKAELVQKVRKGLGTREIADDRLDSAVSYRLAENNKLSGTLAARLAHYQEEREKILADQKTIREAGADGVCPLCRQKLGEHFGSLDADFSARLLGLEEKEAADLARQENLRKEKPAIESLKSALASVHILDEAMRHRPVYEQEREALREQKKKKEEEQKAITNAIVKLVYSEEAFKAALQKNAGLQGTQLRITALGNMIGQGQMTRQHLDLIRAKIAERNAELARLADEIRTAAFDPAAIAELDTRIAAADTALRNAEVAIANADRDRKFAEEKIAEYKRAEAQIAALQKQAAELKDEIELTKLTRTLIAEYVVYLMQVVRSRLEGEVSRIISEITGGRYEQVLLDEDFNLLVRDVDEDYPIDRFSGGEQDDIAVALRIALSRYLAELHQVHESTFLIFDEIFASQDEERRNNLLTALRTQESRFPQILLISHIAEMQGEFANTLVIEMGSDNASRIRVAE